MKKTKRIGLMMTVAAMALSAGGCLLFGGAAVGAGTYAYVSGNLKTTYDTNKRWQTWTWWWSKRITTPFSGRFTGEMVDGRDYTISLTKVTDETTEILGK